MKTYNLHANEQVLDNGTWCIPLKEQPPEGLQGKYLLNEKKLVFTKELSTLRPTTYEWNGDWHTFLQYPTGSIVRIREQAKSIALRGRWVESCKVEITGNSVKMARTISPKLAQKIGIKLEDKQLWTIAIVDWFNSRYGNKRRKNKVTWEDNPYVNLVTYKRRVK